MWSYPVVQGFAIGASMIIPIGAQNAYLLNQGIKRNHHLTVATICMLCDCFLILLGVYGGGQLLATNPIMMTLITWAGIVFLAIYGGMSFRAMVKPKIVVSDLASNKSSLRIVVLGTLAVTILNPHVYLDTMVILGSVGSQFKGQAQLYFVIGCFIASLTWFYSLALTASKLSSVLARPKTQQLINFIVGIIMWCIAFALFRHWLVG